MTTLSITTDCPESEYSAQFIKAMLERMEVGRKAFGPAKSAVTSGVDPIASLGQRLSAYETTGNTGFLVDIANFAMLAFMNSSPEAYVDASLAAGPGRTWNNGTVSKEPNS